MTVPDNQIEYMLCVDTPTGATGFYRGLGKWDSNAGNVLTFIHREPAECLAHLLSGDLGWPVYVAEVIQL